MVVHPMKASNEPVFWALFGAGGMLAALVGPVLVFLTGLAVPLGFMLPRHAMDYATVLGFARNPFGKIALLAVISLFLFHGCHRMLHSLHDLGWRTGSGARIAFYGSAMLATVATAALLLQLGF
jgi:fumarate reductase subunit D